MKKYYSKSLLLFVSILLSSQSFSQSGTCGSPVVLAVNGTCTTSAFNVSTDGTADEEINASCATGTDYSDGWYSVTGTGNPITITITNTSRDACLAAFTGCATGQIACQMVNSGASTNNSISFASVSGTTYYIQIQRRSGNSSANLSGDVCAISVAPGAGGGNNNCSGATAFGTIPTNGTTVCINNQTTNGATNSNVTPTGSCTSNSGTPDDDIWYSFVATSTSHILSASYDNGSSSDIYWQIFSSSCASTMTSILCTDNNTGGTVGGLTIGNTYYVRMYTYWSGDNSQYDICLSTPPPGPTNDNCTGARAFGTIPTNGTTACLNNQNTTSATTSGVTPTGSCTSNAGTPDDDVWFSFVATTTALELNATYDSGSSSDVYWQIFSGSCSASMTSLMCTDNNSGGTFSGLTIGNTYFIRMYSYYSGDNTQYDICLSAPPPPPANDECTGAVTAPVSSTTTCSSTVAGTVDGAFASSQAVGSSCWGEADDDVWYRFQATSTSQGVNLSNVTGSTTDLYHSVYSGTCSSISAPLVCSDANTSTISGLTIGNWYYVRVYTYTSTGGQTTDFDICITTPPPPPVNSNCAGMVQFCSSSPVTIPAVTNTSAELGNDYGCLGSQPNPYWYYFTMTTAGSINLDLNAPSDVDFALYGPYNTLTAASNDCGSTSAPIDCSFNPQNVESIDVASGNVGRVYLLLVTNFANVNQNISLSFDNPSSSGDCACTPLPVELNDFKIKVTGHKNHLSWKTLSERDNDFFLVQRSKDGVVWESLKMVEGHGNSNVVINYSYFDENPLVISYYRLKQVDFNGQFTYSEIKLVNRNASASFKLYPQPAHKQVKISGEVAEITSIELVDVSGKKTNLEYKQEYGEYIVNLENYSQGMYIINIYSSEGVISEKLIIE